MLVVCITSFTLFFHYYVLKPRYYYFNLLTSRWFVDELDRVTNISAGAIRGCLQMSLQLEEITATTVLVLV